MTRIVHLTDLHFGRERSELVQPLHLALRAVQPELVVVTGDLAHRARRGQFRQAMGFLHGLKLPFVTLPGNHDVPLYNVFARFLFPFRGWRSSVSKELTPQAKVGRLRIFAANTADPFRVRRGVLRRRDLSQITAELRNGPGNAINILACHHPFIEPPGFERGETRRAAWALPRLAHDGLQVILAGHLHHWSVGMGITPATPRKVLILQTGTALCARIGERDHGFSVLDFESEEIAITPWIVDEATVRFSPAAARRFARTDGCWTIVGSP
jgi:3',5'-cyclic AMP phosphodiesterase CpdA